MSINGTRNLDEVCLSEDQRQIIRGSVNLILQRYIFPLQFVLGISGNTLNLLVLLSRGMRSKTNIILASIAFADITFLLVLLPNCLAAFQPFVHSLPYTDFFYQTKNHLTAIANWFSAISIWLILTVTVERLVAIKFPLQAKFYWKNWKLAAVIVSIVVVSFALTFYHHLHYQLIRIPLCNGTQFVYDFRTTDILNGSASGKFYIEICTVLSIVFIIICPLIGLTSLNLGLIFVLRAQHRTMFSTSDRRTSNPAIARNSERKVTAMVAAIVTSFILTNVPSTIVFLWHYAHGFKRMSAKFYDVALISNSLVVTGKMLNFFLYCTSSAHFRQNLCKFFLSPESKLGRLLNTVIDHNYTTYRTQQTIYTPDKHRSRRTSSLISGESIALRVRTRTPSPASRSRMNSLQLQTIPPPYPVKRNSLIPPGYYDPTHYQNTNNNNAAESLV